MMDTADLSSGTLNRLQRIRDLKGYDEKAALEYAISVAWLSAENTSVVVKIKKTPIPIKSITHAECNFMMDNGELTDGTS